MTRQRFRRLILLWWLSGISCVVTALATNQYLPTELRNYQEAITNTDVTVVDWIVFAVAFAVFVCAIIVSVGLYRFRRWAKSLLLPTHIVALILMPFYGPNVMTGWAYTTTYLYSVLTGGLLFLVYLSPVSYMFESKVAKPSHSAD